ncbi:threonine aldolase family protein [Paenisporosarcina cavernae]|uniref:Aminotransferase class I/II-fold pyridoxal phosphate-dependent enzyme n=1 Tax=Paenisporosarcina cavernae TaxID=2320858 RepID=A0A385YP73_9BACL|nr:aminotransferase class I/II-fold pyridoxal phosphate-dependent enzyme [Paenisporosarcina cavernae]AYC28479.1 aminotransferase class I/II-fold pyridoxal phosphate-dependent enzyme [Paenisporosarcina cavernae]
MVTTNALSEAFQATSIQLAGHGKRNIGVLKDVVESLDSETLSDIYGNGEIIEQFQVKMAAYLGKESAVFFPSGTMAQQIALRLWADKKKQKKVAYHPLCHLEIHEADGLKELHHLDVHLLGEENRVVTIHDLESMPTDVAVVLLELPQREIGGQLPEWEELVRMSSYCRTNGIYLHLDGARLYEILPYYGKTAAEVCELFDSAYISMYKGIGGIAGAILAGSDNFIQEAKVWKQRYGGNLISLYPYIVTANAYFDERHDKMPEYYENAKKLAQLFNTCAHIQTVPETPVSNMFHVHIDASKEELERIFTTVMKTTDIGITSYVKEMSDETLGFELSLGDQLGQIPETELENVFSLLRNAMNNL